MTGDAKVVEVRDFYLRLLSERDAELAALHATPPSDRDAELWHQLRMRMDAALGPSENPYTRADTFKALDRLIGQRDALRAALERIAHFTSDEFNENWWCLMADIASAALSAAPERPADQPSASPAGGVPGFKITLTCAHLDEHGVNDPCWTAMVDRFPHVRGYADGPVEAVRLAAEAAAELWFNDEHRPADQTDEQPKDPLDFCW